MRTPRQLDLCLKNAPSHGGARAGAGRKRSSKFQPHIARPRFQRREPLHLTLRVHAGIPSLRRKDLHRELKWAVRLARERGLRIVHFSLLSNHVHLIAESRDQRALARQMQSLSISFSKRINALLSRAGAVFRERYHVHVLRTPREVKNALAYVLTNELKHRGGRGRVDLDRYSSAIGVSEAHWARLLGRSWSRLVAFPPWHPDEEAKVHQEVAEIAQAPESWLLKTGWLRG